MVGNNPVTIRPKQLVSCLRWHACGVFVCADFELTVTLNANEAIDHVQIQAVRGGASTPRVVIVRYSQDNYSVSIGIIY